MRLKPIFRKLLGTYSHVLNRVLLPGHWPQHISIVFYHTIAPEPPIFTKGAFPVKTPEAFEQDLDILLKTMKPAGVEDLFSNSSGKDKFLLTFDDGLKGCYDYVMPILIKKGIEAVFFVNPAFVDNRSIFYRYKANLITESLKASERASKTAIKNKKKTLVSTINNTSQNKTTESELKNWLANAGFADVAILDDLAPMLDIDFDSYLVENKPYLSLAELKEMRSYGFTIGAHSMRHPLYTDIRLVHQAIETVDSLKWVVKHLYPYRQLFAFPFTADGIDPFLLYLVTQEVRVDAFFGTSGYHYKGDILQRIALDGNVLPADKLLAFEWMYTRLKSIVGK